MAGKVIFGRAAKCAMDEQRVGPIVREARHLAVDRGVSLSAYISLLVEEHVHVARRRRGARERQLKLMEQGIDLKTGGNVRWGRDELHER